MREIRQSGSEGGGTETNWFSLPLSRNSLPDEKNCRISGAEGSEKAGRKIFLVYCPINSWTNRRIPVKLSHASNSSCS